MNVKRFLPVLRHHGPWNLALDVLFVVWAVFFMVSGHVVPGPLEALFASEPPANVVVEPGEIGDPLPSGLEVVETPNPA